MSDLFCDIAYDSINMDTEILCGDKIEVKENNNFKVIVLADGLSHGIKANILATLTSTMLTTMLINNVNIEEAVSTVVETLPSSKEYGGVAYSTFTVLKINNDKSLEIIQYDNPKTIMYRDGFIHNYETSFFNVKDKICTYAKINVVAGDTFVATSDGCINASTGKVLDLDWNEKSIAEFLEPFTSVFFPANSINQILLDEVNRLYDNHPQDDCSAVTLYFKKRKVINLLFGPPTDKNDTERVLGMFFAKEGQHIISGGTTSKIAAKYLNKEIYFDGALTTNGIPPISRIHGVDLVTEGVVTMAKVIENIIEYNSNSSKDGNKFFYLKDGASLITSMLVMDATDINIFCGLAINPAHQNPNLHINVNIKHEMVESLETSLKTLNKNIVVNYF